MGDISTTGEHLIISGDKIPVSAYQAIYHKLTSKVEKITQIFPDAYIINTEDIIQLNRLLQQSIVQYPVKSSNATCVVSLHKHENIEPSSFEKFKTFNFQMNKPTSKVSYQFDFFTVLPVEIKTAEDIVQRFKVSIVIDQDFVEDSDDGVPIYLRTIMSGNNINLVVEYSDYNVGRNLQVTVQDWVNSLETKRVPAWIKIFEEKADFITSMFPKIAIAACLFGLTKWYNPADFRTLASSIFFGLGWAVMAHITAQVIVVEAYRQLAEARPLTFICITNGDFTRKSLLASRIRRKSSLSIALLTIALINIPVNLFSNYIFRALF